MIFFILIVDDVLMNHKVLSKTILNKLNITCNDKMSTVKCVKKNIINNVRNNAINAITVIYERYTNHQPIDLILLDRPV
jgi:CheY-like chemotaxis protein